MSSAFIQRQSSLCAPRAPPSSSPVCLVLPPAARHQPKIIYRFIFMHFASSWMFFRQKKRASKPDLVSIFFFSSFAVLVQWTCEVTRTRNKEKGHRLWINESRFIQSGLFCRSSYCVCLESMRDIFQIRQRRWQRSFCARRSPVFQLPPVRDERFLSNHRSGDYYR